jgi:hypothetical protein
MQDAEENKREEKRREWRMRGFIICTPNHILLTSSSHEDEVGGTCSKRREMRNAYKILS